MSSRRHYAIFATGSPPWMTGTAINPLFRAAYLAQGGHCDVTLVIPWLYPRDQRMVYPDNFEFESPHLLGEYVRCWVDERTGFESSFQIVFYPAKFSHEMESIMPIGDITECIPRDKADIAVLEEPQHLTRNNLGREWKKKFRQVIGIVHTNCQTALLYVNKISQETNSILPVGDIPECIPDHIADSAVLEEHHQLITQNNLGHWWRKMLQQVMGVNTKCQNAHFHKHMNKITRLSGATQELPRSVVSNVHGVNQFFIKVGKGKSSQLQSEENTFKKGAYYIGESKGYKELHFLLCKNQSKLSDLELDLYLHGSQGSDEVHESAKHLSLAMNVHPGRDHSDPLFHEYKVLINPSTTNVICRTTAEALAMGKIVICANHPSNEFFRRFSNCHIYDNDEEFVQLTLDALSKQPTPLTYMERHELSWEAATERFVEAACKNSLSEQLALFTPLTDMHRYNELSWRAATERFYLGS